MKTKWFEKLKKITAWVVLIQLILAMFPVSVAYGAPFEKSPTAHGSVAGFDGFDKPHAAYTEGANQARSEESNQKQDYLNYGFEVPSEKEITSVEVKVKAKTNNKETYNSSFAVQLSWDGGTNWTDTKDCGLLDNQFELMSCNSTDLLWGRVWIASELSNSNFRVRVSSNIVQKQSATSVQEKKDKDDGGPGKSADLDWIPVTVTYKHAVAKYQVSAPIIGQGSVDGAGQYNAGDEVALSASPDEGWSFDYWSGDCAGTLNPYIINNISSDYTCTANFKINQFTVTFDADGGTPTPDDQPLEYGDLVELPVPEPEKTGYSFVCWIEDEINEDQEVMPSIIKEPIEDESPCWDFDNNTVTADHYLVATWDINQYTITFNTAGGSLIDPITQDYATSVTAPTNPTREGYAFVGWDRGVPESMPAEDITITAVWVPLLITTPVPTILTPILAAAPVAAAAPAAAVAGEVDEPEEVAAAVDEPAEEAEEVKGSSDRVCPWWWIIGLLLIASLGFMGGVIKAEDDDSMMRRYWYIWPPVFGGVAWLLHLWLHNEFKATWFCDNYWMVVALVAVVALALYRTIVRKRDNS